MNIKEVKAMEGTEFTYVFEDGDKVNAEGYREAFRERKEVLENTGVSLDEAKVLEKKDHRHSVLPKGIHFVGIQQRFDPLANLKKRVID